MKYSGVSCDINGSLHYLDFAVQGNAFDSGAIGGSNEAGIVWVMLDVNGNGLLDDEWYGLRGSETEKKTPSKSILLLTIYQNQKKSIVH